LNLYYKKGAHPEEVRVNEWIGIAGIGITILVHIGGTITFLIKLSNRVATNETNIDNIKDILDKQATQEGLTALSQKIDLFYSLIRETADKLVAKHADQVTEYRKSLISSNHTMDRLEKQVHELEKENQNLRKQK